MNEVILMGRFTADPEMKVTTNETAYCDFTVAVTRPYNKKGEEKITDFIRCKAWGSIAEFIGQYFSKGQMVALTGSLRTGSYSDKNHPDVTHYTTTVAVNRVEFCGNKAESGKEPEKGNKEVRETSISEYDDILAGDYTPF